MGHDARLAGTRGRVGPALTAACLVAGLALPALGPAARAAPATSGSKTSASTAKSNAKAKAKAKPTAKASASVSASVKSKSSAGTGASARASAKAKPQSKTSAGAGDKTRTKGHAAVKTPPPAPAAPVVPMRVAGKVAVFVFDGDGAAPLRARVLHVLRSHGLQINTGLRPLDSPEQYRETADALGLLAFIDGEASEDGDAASVTVHVRSGVSGLRVASATLSGERRKLAAEVDKSLWEQLGTPLGRVSGDAAKPRKHDREPMRIEAGTPLEDHPPAAGDRPKENRDPKPPAAPAPSPS